jgi:hypothetical protein
MHIGVDETIPLFLIAIILSEIEFMPNSTLKIMSICFRVNNLFKYKVVRLKIYSVDELNFKPWYSYFEIANGTNTISINLE